MARFLALPALVLLFGCAPAREPKCALGEQRSVAEWLYFGTAKATGVVTREEWAEFLRTSVTPRFPLGLTVWEAYGQWQEDNGAITREGSFVLNLVHPGDERSDAALRAIAAEYKARFVQKSVLRVRSRACAAF